MNDSLRQILPVVISIVTIIAIAVLRAYSKTLTAITATMPLTIPLTLWIVYAADHGNRQSIETFTGSLFLGIGATVIFVVVLYGAARAGLGLIGMLAVSYSAWALVLGSAYLIRSLVR